jgi:YD repeat-containing protein
MMDENTTERHNDVSKRMLRALLMIVLTAVCAVRAAPASAQQGGTTRYVYDDKGRLIAVVSPTGEGVIYDYDSAGNFTAIRRAAADTLLLLGFFPREGGAGDQVMFVGTGFNAGVTSVSFNGAVARIIEASPSAVIAEVPDGATTGPVIIITPRGMLTTPVPFTIVARVRVFPSNVTLSPGDTFAFTAAVGGGGDQSVSWSVNAIAGGNSSVGTISAAGLYIAPVSLTGNQSLSAVVRATSGTQPLLFGESTVRVLNPNNLGALFAPMLSISKGNPRAAAALVSLRKGVVINGPGPITSPLVTVRRGVVLSGPSTLLSPVVSVRLGGIISGPSSFISALVSITTGPSISAVSPGSVARGAIVTLTVTGNNLSGASALRFLDASGLIDPAITASDLTASADGTSLTATVVVGGSAAPGERILVVSAQSISSPPVKTGLNAIQIVQ